MYKKLKLILIVIIVSILGYKIFTNQNSLKDNFSWMFEGEDEMALPELSNEEIEKSRKENQDNPIKKVEETIIEPVEENIEEGEKAVDQVEDVIIEGDGENK